MIGSSGSRLAALLRAAALGLAALAAAPAPGLAQDAFAPAAFVDGRAVTNFDVDQRLRLLRIAGIAGADEEAALQSMIDDRLKRAAAEASGVSVEREDVDVGLSRFARSQGLDAGGLERRLRREGISLAVVREYIETEVLWSAVVRRDYGVSEEVTELELDDEIAANGLDRTVSYRLGEIAIPSAPDRAAASALAADVVAQVRAGGDFSALARRHSRSPSARNGGGIGTLPAERLPAGLANALASMSAGDVTEPFEVEAGFIILGLFERVEERRELSEADREAIRAQLLDRRLARRAEGRLSELRAEAYVDRL